MLKAAKEASKLGNIGFSVAQASSANANTWLNSRYADFDDKIKRAGVHGSEGADCDRLYGCENEGIKSGGIWHLLTILKDNFLVDFNQLF